jgi:hypothetical protein
MTSAAGQTLLAETRYILADSASNAVSEDLVSQRDGNLKPSLPIACEKHTNQRRAATPTGYYS